ncbi:SAM-dependent methyltransferase [Streptomyces sp. AC563]|uniref:class I SAM-dependent methyltransferase n=1 Tax=Streptomyces buecherae TaxID=2763006 RepID=UPI00164E51B6|nr:SAM-dependent methyltransferase [Streptomyces buecherae]MBC3989702.1 SAM-dependent methyltransferase [Streptomyces buecherae]
MFRSPLASTACMTAAARARESRRTDALFVDPWANLLAGDVGWELQRRFETASGAHQENPYIAVRTRWADDHLRTAARRHPDPQVVLLAAGMDCRAIRLDWPAGTVVYEVDQPELLRHKEAALTGAGAQPNCERRVVAADLNSGWAGPLVSAGVRWDLPVIWVVEGLLMYFDAGSAQTLLAELTALSVAGSELVADFVSPGFLRQPWLRPGLDLLESWGTPWQFAVEEPADLLRRLGWRPTVHEPGDLDIGGRPWPYPPAPRGVSGQPRLLLTTALRS